MSGRIARKKRDRLSVVRVRVDREQRSTVLASEDAAGLEGVPIPVWTTKSFMASWEQTLKSPPLGVNLTYHTKAVRDKFVSDFHAAIAEVRAVAARGDKGAYGTVE